MGQQLFYLNFPQLLHFNIIFQLDKYFALPYSFRSTIAQFSRAPLTREAVVVRIDCECTAAFDRSVRIQSIETVSDLLVQKLSRCMSSEPSAKIISDHKRLGLNHEPTSACSKLQVLRCHRRLQTVKLFCTKEFVKRHYRGDETDLFEH